MSHLIRTSNDLVKIAFWFWFLKITLKDMYKKVLFLLKFIQEYEQEVDMKKRKEDQKIERWGLEMKLNIKGTVN